MFFRAFLASLIGCSLGLGQIAAQESFRRPLTLAELIAGPRFDEEEKEERNRPLVTDRPDFTLPSTTVGLGRIVIESGYSFTRDRTDDVVLEAHSFPETLVRIGVLAEWLELQIGQNYVTGSSRDRAAGTRQSAGGATDLLVGLNFALTEQKGWLPETAFQVTLNLPTGDRDITNNRRHVNPGVFYTYYWDVVKDKIGVTGTTGLVQRNEESGDTFGLYYQTIEALYSVTEKATLYIEGVGFMPTGSQAVKPIYFMNGGLIYLLTENLQWDIYAGYGLNREAPDFFAGSGISIRF